MDGSAEERVEELTQAIEGLAGFIAGVDDTTAVNGVVKDWNFVDMTPRQSVQACVALLAPLSILFNVMMTEDPESEHTQKALILFTQLVERISSKDFLDKLRQAQAMLDD